MGTALCCSPGVRARWGRCSLYIASLVGDVFAGLMLAIPHFGWWGGCWKSVAKGRWLHAEDKLVPLAS